MPNNYQAVRQNKADRMGPGGSRRPRNSHHATATAASAASRQDGRDPEHEFDIIAYRTTLWRTFFFYALSFGTCGIFRLILHWFPKRLIQFRAKLCSVEHADMVLVVDNHNRHDICNIYHRNQSGTDHTVVANTDGTLTELEELRWFNYRKLQYTWIDGEWSTPSRAYSHVTPEALAKSAPASGLKADDVALRRTYFGMNVMPVKLSPFYELVYKEVLSPFYIFQAISVTVWYIDDYVWYALLIIVMSLYSVVMTLRQTRSQQRRLQSMVVEHDEVEVIRENGRVCKMDSSEIVPGDVMVIPPQGCMMYCDCVLLNGTVIVNESMLTGESIPITKSAISDDGHEKVFSMEKHGKNIIFNGTKVLQTKYYKGQHVKALVIRTAYSTTKGQLIRAIMYPKPADFKFFSELMKFIGVLSIVAFFGFMYTSIILFYRGSSIRKIVIRALDLVTIVVPPALPAVMGIGIFYAQRRLRQMSIYCISPTTINTCGAIDVVCFDKTGTLTEDGLDFYALRVVDNARIGENIVQISTNDTCQNVVRAIATCHTLSKINHELHGDPLDVIMFEQTGYSLEEDDSESHESIESIQPILIRPPKDSTLPDCQIVKQFTFSSGLQRQSVIVTDEDSMKAYCKGSPEMIMSLCQPETVPENFHDIVEEYSQHGYRLIAVAEKELTIGSEVQKVPRQSIECDLTLIGLVALENRLKPVTTEVIQQLNEANIRSVMVTGDNILTALSVARECGIIVSKKTAYLIEHENGVVDKMGRTILTIREKSEHHTQERQSKSVDLSKMSNSECQFAISGSTFSVVTHEYPELLDQLVCVCNVFARMAPEQKQLLVEHLQTVGSTVAMCGDGANDCAALKAAHAGISLSEAEASIAAPFTSKVSDIRCVITLISEGRCALVTSYSAFLCMAGYSLTQFISILLLYWNATSFSQMQFLFIDIAIVTNLAFLSSKTRAYKGLASTPPPTSILSTASMVSLFGQLAIGGMAQIAVFCWITLQPWFIPFQPTHHDNDEDRKSMQGTAIFYVSLFHYIVLYFVFAAGPPYRASITSNKAFLMSMISVTIGCILLVVFYLSPIQYFLGCLWISQEFCFIILAVALLTAIISVLYDRCVDWISTKIREKIRQRRKGA
ncbi:hypothetical protein L3Y34_005309 [Caenorhabditis briggsae]|uniref:Cation-transporting ATPase n=3 Tax=Caenorhabditis briggsae TaxID=6238 RepID=A0AAE9D767_CAEBR|nr:hypothetical protein L3Y34_005309 [Caenorhabditis briggsae]